MRLVKSFFIISSLVLSGARSTLKGDSELSTSGELPKASTLTPAAEAWSSVARESDDEFDAVLDTATMAEDAPCSNYTCCDTGATVCAMQNYENITYFFSNILNCVTGDCPTGWVNATTPPPPVVKSGSESKVSTNGAIFITLGTVAAAALVTRLLATYKEELFSPAVREFLKAACNGVMVLCCTGTIFEGACLVFALTETAKWGALVGVAAGGAGILAKMTICNCRKVTDDEYKQLNNNEDAKGRTGCFIKFC